MAYLVGRGHMHYGPGTSMIQFTRPVFGMGCACGCNSGKCGGMGLFDTGIDVSGWGWQEFTIVGLGAYMLFSTLFTTGRAVKRVRAIPGERRKRKAERLRKEASELTKKRKGLFD